MSLTTVSHANKELVLVHKVDRTLIEYVGSHANKELVLVHKVDRTLIEAEYVFWPSMPLPLDQSLSLETFLDRIVAET